MISAVATLLELGDRRFGVDQLASDVIAELASRALIRQDGRLDETHCPNCDDEHSVELAEFDDGYRGLCIRTGWIRLKLADVVAWKVDRSKLLSMLAAGFGLKSPRTTWLVDAKLVWLGALERRLDGKLKRIDLCVAIGGDGEDVLAHLWTRRHARLRGNAHLLLTTRNWGSVADDPPPQWALVDLAHALRTSDQDSSLAPHWPHIDSAIIEALEGRSPAPGRPSTWYTLLPSVDEALGNNPNLALDDLTPAMIVEARRALYPAAAPLKRRTVSDHLTRCVAHLKCAKRSP